MTNWQILHGDCLNVMRGMEPNSVDAIVTDPPYELAFMGKRWDGTGIAFQAATWAETYRVLKPGGFMLAFGGTRTSHRMVCAIEDAGFEIRDTIAWLYGSGFPKSLDVSKAIDKAAGAERAASGMRVYASGHVQHSRESIGYGGSNPAKDRRLVTAPATDAAREWGGWGTALKPAHEPICVARKPLSERTVVANVLKHGTGALNIDAGRIGTTEIGAPREYTLREDRENWRITGGSNGSGATSPLGRWPANVCLDEEAAAMLDEQSGTLTSGANPTRRGSPKFRTVYREYQGQEECTPARGIDRGGASRFFYVAKASRRERNAGLEGLPEREPGQAYRLAAVAGFRGLPATCTALHPTANHHPTVKPIALMRWLVRLVTPPGGVVLDPFAGSGTTGGAAVLEGFNFIGIEQDVEYVEIARRRIAHCAAEAQQLSLVAD